MTIPYLLLSFVLVFHDLVKILILIALLIILVFQIIHYKKTKIKDYGTRILITIVSIVALGSIIHYGYGLIKNKQAKDLVRTIEKISFERYEINQKQLENNLKFVNEKSLIFKGTSDATIYYTNGTTEKTQVYYPGFYIIQIKGDKYYISVLDN